MKKTVTANVSGTVFHIEEDAYDKLQRYLTGIRGTFTGSHGSDEIMADIEARIAELFSERLQGRQVVTLADVEHVMGVMGQPEDFASGAEGPGAGADAGPGSAPPPPTGPRHRRLFRDPDDHWVGGVLGGIAAYFRIDPLWLRIGFLVVMIAGWGSPIVIYLLLWILVPQAETPADKLAMHGEPVTVDNIKRVFDEGAERFRGKAERFGEEAKKWGEQWSDPNYRQRQYQRTGAERVIRGAGSVIARLVGLGLLLFGAFLAFCFIAGLISGHSSFVWHGDSWGTDGIALAPLADAWFISPDMTNWAWAALIVLCLVPIIAVLLGGIRLLFSVHIPRWFGWVLTPIWFFSLAMAIVIGARQANEYRQRERITDTIDLPSPTGHVLHIAAMHDPLFGDEREQHDNDLDLLEIGGDSIQWGWAELDVQASPDSLFHLEIVRRANGPGVKAAQRRARDIRASYTVSDSLLAISPLYTTSAAEKLRSQSVDFIVRVPEGSSVRFERNTARIIYDISNTTNTLDREMVGRTWTMTPEGLAPGLPTQQRDTTRIDGGELKMEVNGTEDGKPVKVKMEVKATRGRQSAMLDHAPDSRRAPALGLFALLRTSVRL